MVQHHAIHHVTKETRLLLFICIFITPSPSADFRFPASPWRFPAFESPLTATNLSEIGMLPPPTPLLPSARIADYSLLLSEQPIFDTSLEDTSAWGLPDMTLDTIGDTSITSEGPYVPISSTLAASSIPARPAHLNLDAYLPISAESPLSALAVAPSRSVLTPEVGKRKRSSNQDNSGASDSTVRRELSRSTSFH